MLTKKDKVEQLKRDLKSYKFHEGSVEEINLKLESINTKLQGVGSPKLDNTPMGFSEDSRYRLYDLMEEEFNLVNERSKHLAAIKEIDELLAELSEEDREFLTLLYIERKSYFEISEKYNISDSSAKRKANSIIKSIL